MNVPSTIPVTVTSEAQDHVAALGVQAEFEKMVEQMVQIIPDLQRINVVLDPPYDMGTEDRVVIEAYKLPAAYVISDPARQRWNQWVDDNISPVVRQHFSFMLIKGSGHAG